jgi:hypothetical protein
VVLVLLEIVGFASKEDLRLYVVGTGVATKTGCEVTLDFGSKFEQ